MILIFTGVIALCCAIMLGSSYLYLEISLNSAETDANESNVPYASPLPDSAGILLSLPDESGYLIYLNFSTDSITVAKIEELQENAESYFGYPVNFTIVTDYNHLANLIDRLGGIELEDSGETFRYTGFQVLERIDSDYLNNDLKREVIRKFFEAVSLSGISKEDFIYIIENTETDITVPDCYYWPPYIAQMAENLQFIN